MNYRAEIMSDGDLLVLCSSILGGNYQGLTGEICTVRLRIDKEAYGNLPIQLYLVKACDPQYQAYTLPTVTFSVNVDKGLLGDVMPMVASRSRTSYISSRFRANLHNRQAISAGVPISMTMVRLLTMIY